MDRKNIDKVAQTPEDKLLLAKIWDKIQLGISRNIPSNTSFLSPREQELARYLFGDYPGLVTWGGYDDAERKMLVYLPDYFDESFLVEKESPLVCIRAGFYEGDIPSHRDFLGALIGIGITRESIGDICVGKGFCIFFVTSEIAPYILQNFLSAGRTKLSLTLPEPGTVVMPEAETKEIKDTVASLRLDSVISSGFRIGRTLAVQYIATGKAAIDGIPCEKPDKTIVEGAKISVRGLGKIRLRHVSGPTKKGRLSVIIDRYI